jgi:magnesium-transporting ATPase (P-type)
MNVFIDTYSPNNNYISYNKFKFSDIPVLSLKQYFLNSRENLYFLLLSFFQLSTYSKISLLPSHWSPSGPFSTFIPLLLCYLIELLNIIYQFIIETYKTYKFNYCNTITVINKKTNIGYNKKIKDIVVGDLLLINKNSIIPVDGLVYKIYDDEYAKINLANLNGECNILCKDSLVNIDESIIDICDIKIVHIKNNSDSIKLFNSVGIINNKKYILDHKYFIPGGSMNTGKEFLLIITQIGNHIRSYTSCENEKIFSSNKLDDYVTNSLVSIFIPLLGIYIFSIVYFAYKYSFNSGLVYMIEKSIQAWILLNGIVPFSVKILLGLNRTIQSFLKTNSEVEYLNPKCIDNFTKIQRIICDKTGTLTKNELLLTHFSYKNIIYNNFNSIKIPFHFIYKIVLGLHHQNRIFCTTEDQIICEKLVSIGTCLELNGTNIIINRNYESKYIKLIEMQKLEFDCVRKKSSVIFYEPDEKAYYIVTKGSIDAVYNLLNKSSMVEYNSVLKQYNEKYPFLRTIAFSIKKINYDETRNPLEYETEGGYDFLTLLGIQDELQKECISTMNILKNNNKRISICTGDRYETALYIANELNLLGDIQTFNISDSFSNISEKTFIFNSCDLQLAKTNYNLMTYLSYNILHSKNFIAYSLIPKDKKFITNIFEGNDINTIAIGDGNNDVPMLKTTTLAIGVNKKYNSNVVNNSHITISNFGGLTKILQDSQYCYAINITTIYAVFYKTVLTNSLVYLYIVYNSCDLQKVLFNFIEIQGHHLIWGLLPIIGLNFNCTNYKQIAIKNIRLYAILHALMNACLIMCISHFLNDNIRKKIVILTIICININFIILFGYHKSNIIMCILSIILGLMYIIFYFE